MRSLFIILGGIAAFLSLSADALEISYSRVGPFGGSINDNETLLLKGEIMPGDYDYLLEVIWSNQDRFWRSRGFVLASPGGDIQEALKIANLIKGTYSAVMVGEAAGPCVSACFFLFAAAVRREAYPEVLGIHRPYINPQRLTSTSVREAEILQKTILEKARSYLENLDVPRNLIDKMFQRASTEVYWLSLDEIHEQLGRRPPWYEQFLIARCGLDKSRERKYFTGKDNTALEYIKTVDACGIRLSRPEAKAFLKAELMRSNK